MMQGFSNARIVLEDVVLHGAVLLGAGGNIADILGETSPIPGTEDCAGDFLLPGCVDVHTDNLERQVQPRRHVHWPLQKKRYYGVQPVAIRPAGVG